MTRGVDVPPLRLAWRDTDATPEVHTIVVRDLDVNGRIIGGVRAAARRYAMTGRVSR